jgi:DNA excision repair protein ERCC-2
MADAEGSEADAGAGGPDDADWRAVFGHEEPYAEQADGIEAAVETAREGGFTVVEGACGTGKTMLALTAGLHLVRDPESDYERVVVLTSVKQQLRQFEADLRTINANLPEGWDPVSGLTLVGKADVCPYEREGCGGMTGGNVYDRCEALRERTRGLAEEGDPASLADRTRSQQVGIGEDARYLETAGEPAPYPPEMPEDGDTEYCPFYARYLADLPEDGDPVEAVPFDHTEMGHLDPEDLVGLAVEGGTCPHSTMGALLPHAEVVVGNYYHAFDPVTTATFTGPLLDDSTFVVCDEAHMLEPRVRDLVSDGVGDRTLRDAETELSRVLQPLEYDADRSTTGSEAADAELVRGELQDTDLTEADLRQAREFLADLRAELDRRVTAHLDETRGAWRADLADLEDAEIPLRDPEDPGEDEISAWARREGYVAADWTRLEAVGAVVARVLNEAEDEEKQRALPAVGRTLGAWHRCDHEGYFREIVLERTWDATEPGDAWRRAYNAELALRNCVPGDAIAERLGEFGGGVLMSATLAPLDVFETVTGLEDLAADGRPIAERTYGLSFPAENRASFAVAAPKFTHDNRGAPGEDTEARRVHGDAIREVAGLEGNVLVGMPSYREAEWAADLLADADVGKPVLRDAASDDGTTESLKEDFFAGEGKVLVTSLRGTLTEGVDYRGDRLAAAVVCGVPIVNTASPRTRAVRTAYDRRFDGNGFEYALLVPAVRKARQAVGRVIRGPEETGVRVLVDERYARESWDSVRDLLSPSEREEFRPVSPDMLGVGLERFRG